MTAKTWPLGSNATLLCPATFITPCENGIRSSGLQQQMRESRKTNLCCVVSSKVPKPDRIVQSCREERVVHGRHLERHDPVQMQRAVFVNVWLTGTRARVSPVLVSSEVANEARRLALAHIRVTDDVCKSSDTAQAHVREGWQARTFAFRARLDDLGVVVSEPRQAHAVLVHPSRYRFPMTHVACSARRST